MENNMANITYLHNLVLIALADGNFNEKEKKVLVRKANELGFPEEDVDFLIHNPEDLQWSLPVNLETKKRYLFDCIEMACCDGVLHEEEKKYILRICDLLDIDETFVFEGMELAHVKDLTN